MPHFPLSHFATDWVSRSLSRGWAWPALCRHRAAGLLALCLALCLALPGRAQPGRPIPGLPFWEWQNPRPTGYALNGAHLFNDSTAIVVGNHGTALKTTNRGRTWLTLNVGTVEDLKDVQFVNDLVGWVTYGLDNPVFTTVIYQFHGEVRKTIDGGRTWAVQRTGEPIYANPSGNLQMQSPTQGFLYYALLVPGSGAPPEGRLRRTIDGGQTWSLVGPVPTYALYNDLKCQFFGPLVGYAVGNSLLKTVDGGRSWRSIAPPGTMPYFSNFSFIDAQNGWVVYDNGPDVIYRTRDGGATWTTLPALYANFATFPRSITFIDALHGWAVLGSELCVQTTDGGVSWQWILDLSIGSFNKIVLRPSGAGFALGRAGQLAATRATGAPWVRRDSTAFGNGITPSTGISESEPAVAGLTMCDPVRGWAFSGPGGGINKLLRTENRGKRWQSIDLQTLLPTLLDWPNSTLQAAAFPDADTAFVAIRTYIYLPNSITTAIEVIKTTDAGRTWQRLPDPPGATQAGDLRFYDSRRGLLVGAGTGGGVWLTEDGGQSWQLRPRLTTKKLLIVRWADARTAYIGGDSTAFLRSTDAGRTWQLEPAATTAVFFRDIPIDRIEVASPQVLVVNGYLRVTDGGRTWDPLNPPDRHLAFCSPTKGWNFGRQVYRTTTGGRTWTPLARTGDLSLSSKSQLIDPYNGWLPGNAGLLLHYSEKFITARPLAQTTHCAGGTLALAFDTTGQFPTNEQRFAAQLSNARGRFRPGQIRVVGQGTASPLAVALPFDVPAGSAYRLRVVQADSLVLGADTGQNLTINPAPTATIAPAGPQTLCAGRTLTLSAPAGLAQYLWSTGATTRTLAVTTGGTYAVRVAGANGCLGPPSAAVTVRLVPLPAPPVIRQSPGGQLSVTPLAGATYQWTRNGTAIAGATAASYPATGAAPVGTYTAVVTNGDGCASAASAPLVVVLTTRPALAADFSLYPNPTPAAFIVERPAGGGAARVVVLDALGRCAWQQALPPQQTRLAGPPLPGGAYQVLLYLASGEVVGRRLVVVP